MKDVLIVENTFLLINVCLSSMLNVFVFFTQHIHVKCNHLGAPVRISIRGTQRLQCHVGGLVPSRSSNRRALWGGGGLSLCPGSREIFK